MKKFKIFFVFLLCCFFMNVPQAFATQDSSSVLSKITGALKNFFKLFGEASIQSDEGHGPQTPILDPKTLFSGKVTIPKKTYVFYIGKPVNEKPKFDISLADVQNKIMPLPKPEVISTYSPSRLKIVRDLEKKNQFSQILYETTVIKLVKNDNPLRP